jgi:hypothetical protein
MNAAIVTQVNDESLGRGQHSDGTLQERPCIPRGRKAIDAEVTDIAVQSLGTRSAV